jgi:hypothetical protein
MFEAGEPIERIRSSDGYYLGGSTRGRSHPYSASDIGYLFEHTSLHRHLMLASAFHPPGGGPKIDITGA